MGIRCGFGGSTREETCDLVPPDILGAPSDTDRREPSTPKIRGSASVSAGGGGGYRSGRTELRQAGGGLLACRGPADVHVGVPRRHGERNARRELGRLAQPRHAALVRLTRSFELTYSKAQWCSAPHGSHRLDVSRLISIICWFRRGWDSNLAKSAVGHYPILPDGGGRLRCRKCLCQSTRRT